MALLPVHAPRHAPHLLALAVCCGGGSAPVAPSCFTVPPEALPQLAPLLGSTRALKIVHGGRGLAASLAAVAAGAEGGGGERPPPPSPLLDTQAAYGELVRHTMRQQPSPAAPPATPNVIHAPRPLPPPPRPRGEGSCLGPAGEAGSDRG